MKLIMFLLFAQVFILTKSFAQTGSHYNTFSYTIEGVENESQLSNLINELQKLYKEALIKYRYKPESKKAEIIINYQEEAIKGENNKQKIDPALIKQKIIQYGMQPVDFTIQPTK